MMLNTLTHKSIEAWIQDVNACCSIPPPPVTKHSLTYDFSGHYGHKCEQKLPHEISNQINQQLQSSIGHHDNSAKALPHPIRNPLVRSKVSITARIQTNLICQRLPRSDALVLLYCHVMELRDLHEVQRLMLARRLPPPYLDLFPTLAQALASAELDVKRCEESVIYMMNWTALQEWRLDFKPVEERRRSMLADDHPCTLIQPFVREIPFAGEGSEDDLE
jgi:hypothetical protein